MYRTQRDPRRYDDMLNLPHHVSPNRPRMSRLNRAAQFAPFDALSGYSAAIRESARTTECKTDLDESAKLRLDRQLRRLLEQQSQQPRVSVTWFRPDDRKSGGAYQTTTGGLKKIDVFRGALLLTNGWEIPVEQILCIDSDLFSCLDDLA